MSEKKLGFGLMRLPLREIADTKREFRNDRYNGYMSAGKIEVNMDRSCAMVDEFISKGFTYFDTSHVYLNGASEEITRKILIERHKRDTFTIATKMPTFSITKKEEVPAMFEGQLATLGVDYVDYYMLHNVQNHLYDQFIKPLGEFEYIAEQKKAGRIRNIGLSFHDSPKLLDRILTEHPEVDFVQIVLNYYDWDSAFVQAGGCYETIRKHGKKVVAMGPVKGGALAELPAAADKVLQEVHPDWSPSQWAMRFAAGLDGVICALSGMNTMAQVRENISYMKDFQPLAENEIATLKEIIPLIKESGPLHCKDFSKYDVPNDGNAPIAAILDAYNSCLIQADPTYSTENNYYKTFRLEAKIPAGESWIKGKIIDKDGNDITEIVKKAEKWLLDNTF
mgnify:CR=1 FL=1